MGNFFNPYLYPYSTHIPPVFSKTVHPPISPNPWFPWYIPLWSTPDCAETTDLRPKDATLGASDRRQLQFDSTLTSDSKQTNPTKNCSKSWDPFMIGSLRYLKILHDKELGVSKTLSKSCEIPNHHLGIPNRSSTWLKFDHRDRIILRRGPDTEVPRVSWWVFVPPCDNVKNMRKSNWIISPQMIEKGWKNQNFENLVSDAILDQFWLNFALMMVSRHILATKKLEFWQQEFLAADFFQSVLIKITQH